MHGNIQSCRRCSRWGLRQDLPAHRVLTGQVSRSLRPNCVRELCRRHRNFPFFPFSFFVGCCSVTATATAVGPPARPPRTDLGARGIACSPCGSPQLVGCQRLARGQGQGVPTTARPPPLPKTLTAPPPTSAPPPSVLPRVYYLLPVVNPARSCPNCDSSIRPASFSWPRLTGLSSDQRFVHGCLRAPFSPCLPRLPRCTHAGC